MIVTPPFNSAVLNTIWANIALLAFRDQVFDSVAVQKMVDGFVDEYEDETGVYLVNSTGQVYDSTNDFYSPSFAAALVAYNTGTEVKDTTNNIGNGFNNTTVQTAANSERKLISGSGSGALYIGKDWGVGNSKIISGFKIYAPSNEKISQTLNTVTLKLRGSNNGSSWTDLMTTTVFAGNAGDVIDVTTGITTTTGYRYHSVYILETAGWGSGDHYLQVAEVQFYEQSVNNNMSLVSNPFTAVTQANKARIVVFQEDVDAITLNTDLIASVSRGVNYTPVVLSNMGTYETGKNILVGLVDISGQPAGTNMRYKLDTANSKNLKIHGTGLLWQ